VIIVLVAVGVEKISAQCYSTATSEQVPDSNCDDLVKPAPVARQCKRLHCRVRRVDVLNTSATTIGIVSRAIRAYPTEPEPTHRQ